MEQLIINKDAAHKTATFERRFDAPLSKVWEAWTKSELLEQWWAPKPWRAVTQSFDFREGGRWDYYMLGPDGTKSWSFAEFESIDPQKSFSAKDGFSDEQGNINTDMPVMHWRVEFQEEGDGTKVKVATTFESEEDMQKIISMGMEEGFTMALNNLEELLQA
jgi:uncharacterized protein YndB with AHSA1/START domain